MKRFRGGCIVFLLGVKWGKEGGDYMAKVLRFLKNYWWVFFTTLLTGYFGFVIGVIGIAYPLGMMTNNAILAFGASSLASGFFAMMPVLIAVGTSQKLEKQKKRAWIWGIGFACSCLFFLLWVPEIF